MNTTTPTTENALPLAKPDEITSSEFAMQIADQLEDHAYYRVEFQGKWRVGQFYKDQFFFPLSVNVWIHSCSAIVPIKIEMPQ